MKETLQRLRDAGTIRDWEAVAWPAGLRAEANLLLSAMAPRSPLWLFLSNHDRNDLPVPVDDLLADLRRRIHAIVGGDTAIDCEPWNRPSLLPGDGRYVAPNGTTMQERTLICLICLPLDLNDKQRVRLLRTFIEVGLATNQEVVQVIAGTTTCWLPTGELIDALGDRDGAREGKLQAG